jgi:hypothetical protein
VGGGCGGGFRRPSLGRGSLRRERRETRREAFGGGLRGCMPGPKSPGVVRVAEPGASTLPSRIPQGVRGKRGARARAVSPVERPAHLRRQSRLPIRRSLHRPEMSGPRVRKPQRRRGLYGEQSLRGRQVRRGGVQRRDHELPQGLPLRAGKSAVQRNLRHVRPRRPGGRLLLGRYRLHRAGDLQPHMHAGHLYAAGSSFRQVPARR